MVSKEWGITTHNFFPHYKAPYIIRFSFGVFGSLFSVFPSLLTYLYCSTSSSIQRKDELTGTAVIRS